MNVGQFAKCFPLGSHLCREPMPPMAELKADMENLKRHGFNLIKLQEHWAIDEPQERHYDFARYEELIDHAARLDLGVYLGLTCEQAPGWLWRKHPGCRMVGRNGLPIAYEAQSTLPADGKPGPCFDHPGARADQERFIRCLVQTLGRFENIVVWNTWQEIGYWAERIVGQHVCYCEHTLAAYRRWLEERYGDLDRLNHAWNTRYLDWESIVPTRSARGRDGLAQDVDWFYFMDNVQIAHVLRTRASAIRAADPLGRPVFAHKGSPIIGAGQDWTYARCQDFLGSSCYPAWAPFQRWDDHAPQPGEPVDRTAALRAEMADGVALRYDYLRAANLPNSPVWAAEFQGGPVSTGFHKGRVPAPADLRRWMLTAVGCGVTAISFWVTRAEIMSAELNGFSLLDSSGDSTPRYEEAARVGAVLNRYADLLGRPSWPQAPVAIVVSEAAYQFSQSMIQGGEHLAYSVRGWHRLLWESGIPVDFVEAGQLDEPQIGRYQALILPFPLALAEEVVAKLASYVEQGGHLISEACPGRIDEHGFCRRGELSREAQRLFGVRHQSLTMVREPEGSARWSPLERTWGEYLDAAWLDGAGPLRGQRVRANVYIETYLCVDSAPSLHDGEQVAGTVRAAGRGQAWLLGSFVGHAGTAYRDAANREFVAALLAACGVMPGHQGRLLLRRRVLPHQEAWLLTNPTGEAVTETIQVGRRRQIEAPLGDALVWSGGEEATLTVPPLDVALLILDSQPD